MILFPFAKINLGLNILCKRKDGFHEIETCMIPIPFGDILEITPSKEFEFFQSGIKISEETNSNLCVKAFHLMKNHFDIPSVRIHLRKQIPIGAGLGGGSSDASSVLKGLNSLFGLSISETELIQFAAQLGSDCPFFIKGTPQIATGRGEILREINLSLKGKYLILLNPRIHIGTKEAYEGVNPKPKSKSIEQILFHGIDKWQDELINQFEESIFLTHPKIKQLKHLLIEIGALYASMSGSGSSLFGFFDEKPKNMPKELKENIVFQGFI
jgi:4-diphosphocytidyl-2-C-methyl-D-erythritol kinase